MEIKRKSLYLSSRLHLLSHTDMYLYMSLSHADLPCDHPISRTLDRHRSVSSDKIKNVCLRSGTGAVGLDEEIRPAARIGSP